MCRIISVYLRNLFFHEQAFFPNISGSNGLPIKIQDMEGNEWEFQYRYWINVGSRIYVLEGLRDYIISKKWQPGDTGIIRVIHFQENTSDGLSLSIFLFGWRF